MACSRAHARWCSPAHADTVEGYRAWRAQWEEQREGGRQAWEVAGAANSGVAMHQLEDDEYREAYPPPTFRRWLTGE